MSKKQEISRREFVGLGGAAMVSGLASASPGVAQDRAHDPGAEQSGIRKRPNIILFMPDELRADALSCYGNSVSKTPNMDALAKSGVRFSNCHSQFPVCAASRCSMLTGWPTSVRGHRSLYYLLRPDEPNMFRNLRQAGYDVFWFGKNDALSPEVLYESVTRWGRDTGLTAKPAPTSTAPLTAIRPVASPPVSHGSADDPRQNHDYLDVEAAIKILERKESDRPFCIFLPLISPHPAYGAPGEFRNRYNASQITGLKPQNLRNRPSHFSAMRKTYHLDGVPESTFREVRALYYGAVSFTDWVLGRLLEAIDRTHHTDDTALFVLSDHGDYAGDYGLIEKWPSGLEDCLTHVPLIVRAPGGVHGHTVENFVELYDVMATCLDLADAPPRHTNFARSLAPQMAGGAGDPNRAVHAEAGYNIYEPQCYECDISPASAGYPKAYLQFSQPEVVSRAAMVRTRDYKLVSRPQGQSELYLYKEDPQELENRFGESSTAAVQAKMSDMLLHWYVNTTGISPKDKDQRYLPPFYPTLSDWPAEMTVKILDEA